MGGFALAAAQISQFMKFDEMSETSTNHGDHTSAGSVPVKVPLLGLRLIMMAHHGHQRGARHCRRLRPQGSLGAVGHCRWRAWRGGRSSI